jgi:hypothetical protein
MNVTELVDSGLQLRYMPLVLQSVTLLGMMPGGIAFHHDMFLNIPLLTDFHLLQTHSQTVIDDNLRHCNQKWHYHDYQPGDECLILDHKATKKLDTCFISPFPIIHTHVDGTITIQQTPHVWSVVYSTLLQSYFIGTVLEP